MKKNFLLILSFVLLSTPALRAQLIQSSSLITTVEKLRPIRRGYQSHAQLAYALLNPDSRSLDISAAYIGGFRFNHTFFLGAGAELQYADCQPDYLVEGRPGYLDRPKFFLPVFAHFRAYFLKKRVSPFFALSGGYAIGFPGSKDFSYNDGKSVPYSCGTLFAEPTVGVDARITHKSSLYLSLSYRLYGLPHMDREDIVWTYDAQYVSFDIKQKLAGSLRLMIGITF